MAKSRDFDDINPHHLRELGIAVDISDIYADPTGKVPSEIHIVPKGKWKHPVHGEIVIDDKRIRQMQENFSVEHNDLMVDYEHQSTGTGTAPAAGWITELFTKASGLYARVKWNKKASDFLQAREYRYISPAIRMQATSKKTGRKIGARLQSVALVNTPFFDGMQPLVASENGIDGVSIFGAFEQENPQMLEQIRKMLGLSDDATDEQCFAELKNWQKKSDDDKAPDLTGLYSEFGLEGDEATLESLTKSVKSFKAEMKEAEEDAKKTDKDKDKFVPLHQFTEVKAQLGAVLQERKAEKADAEVDVAFREGKMLKTQIEWYTKLATDSLVSFKAWADSAPRLVDKKTVAGGGAGDDAPTDNATNKMHKQIKEKMVQFKDKTYGECFDIVCADQPELADLVLEESRTIDT